MQQCLYELPNCKLGNRLDLRQDVVEDDLLDDRLADELLYAHADGLSQRCKCRVGGAKERENGLDELNLVAQNLLQCVCMLTLG